MLQTTIEINGSEIECGVITVYHIDEDAYAALIPLKEDGQPAKTDVMIFGCEIDEEEECSFFELTDPNEYQMAAEAFQSIAGNFQEGLL